MGNVLFEELKQQTLGRTILDTVREAIITGQLKPGQPLVQSQIAGELGVSRAPLREALHKLEEEGLVINVPYKGTIVAPLSKRDIEELRSLRTVIERFAARLAIEQLTDDSLSEVEEIFSRMKDAADRGDPRAFTLEDLAIHTKICELSGHALLLEVWQIYAARFRRVLSFRAVFNRDLHDVLNMHVPLLEALRNRDSRSLDAFYADHGADLTAILTASWSESSDGVGATDSSVP
jgi:GntR family transcriptional regulator of gluconate operon